MRPLLLAAVLLLSSSANSKCVLTYQFRNICERFLYDKDCQPGFEELCPPPHITYQDFFCPIFHCVSITVMPISLSLSLCPSFFATTNAALRLCQLATVFFTSCCVVARLRFSPTDHSSTNTHISKSA